MCGGRGLQGWGLGVPQGKGWPGQVRVRGGDVGRALGSELLSPRMEASVQMDVTLLSVNSLHR